MERLFLSEQLGIVKYDPPLPANIAGNINGNFPSEVPKTDEERVQNLDYSSLQSHTYTVTEKLDGTSCTYYMIDGKFGVCTRNYEIGEDDTNAMWLYARKMNIEQKMKDLGRNMAIQGELIGYGIQKNPYKLQGTDLRVFRIIDVFNRRPYHIDDLVDICEKFGMDTVPILDKSYHLPDELTTLLRFANGMSSLNDKTEREGIVLYANESETVHFKVISNNFLEMHED